MVWGAQIQFAQTLASTVELVPFWLLPWNWFHCCDVTPSWNIWTLKVNRKSLFTVHQATQGAFPNYVAKSLTNIGFLYTETYRSGHI